MPISGQSEQEIDQQMRKILRNTKELVRSVKWLASIRVQLIRDQLFVMIKNERIT